MTHIFPVSGYANDKIGILYSGNYYKLVIFLATETILLLLTVLHGFRKLVGTNSILKRGDGVTRPRHITKRIRVFEYALYINSHITFFTYIPYN